MRRIQHFADGPDKILHIETEGCKVNIIIGTHDLSGEVFTTVEILPAEPDDDGRNWTTIGPTAVLVVPDAGTEPAAAFSTDSSAAQPSSNACTAAAIHAPQQNGSCQ